MIPAPAYITSGPHLSGYQVTLGYPTLKEAQDAHEALAKARTANAVGTSASECTQPSNKGLRP